jgi:hypothetical protein
MSYLVVGKKSGDNWDVEVKGVGTTTAAALSGVETAARALLVANGHPDGVDADLQLLLPDFEVDLAEDRMPRGRRPHIELVSGLILLVVVLGAVAYVLSRVF